MIYQRAGVFECAALLPPMRSVHAHAKELAMGTVWCRRWLGVDFVQNNNQCVGCVVDGWPIARGNAPSQEYKDDMRSLTSCNLFLEMEQSRNGKVDWEPSGLALCLTKKTDLFITLAYDVHEQYMFHASPADWLDLPFSHIATTHKNVNGNRDELYARGRVLPWSDLRCHRLFTRATLSNSSSASSPNATASPSPARHMTTCAVMPGFQPTL